MASNDTPSTAAEVARLAQRTPLLATAFNTREVDDGSCAARLRAFGTALRSGRNESRPERPAEVSSQAA
jgi:hypothetical protein